MKGRVIAFDPHSGQGTIKSESDGSHVLVHAKDVNTWPRTLYVGDHVTFSVRPGGESGQLVASEVKVTVRRLEARVMKVVRKDKNINHSHAFLRNAKTRQEHFLHFNSLRNAADAEQVKEGMWIEFTPGTFWYPDGSPRQDARDAIIVDGPSTPHHVGRRDAVKPAAPRSVPGAAKPSASARVLMIDYVYYDSSVRSDAYAGTKFRGVVGQLPGAIDEIIIFCTPGIEHDVATIKTEATRYMDHVSVSVIQSHSPSHDMLVALMARSHTVPEATYYLLVDAPQFGLAGALESIQPASRVYRVFFAHTRPVVPESEQVIIPRTALFPEDRIRILELISTQLMQLERTDKRVNTTWLRDFVRDNLYDIGLAQTKLRVIDGFLKWMWSQNFLVENDRGFLQMSAEAKGYLINDASQASLDHQ